MMEKICDLHIRDARESDRDAIREVTLAAYEEYAAVVPTPLWIEYRQHLLATIDEEGPIERIVAERNGTMVGNVLLYPPTANAYAGLSTSIGWPEVRLLAVVPTARRQGVGTALMDECEQHALRMGATVLGLHTMDMMQAAIRMYERMGFVHTPERDFSPVEGVLVKGYCRRIDQAT